MSKALTMMGIAIAALVGLAFALDLVVGIPFRKANLLIDLGFLFAAAMLGLISWLTLREIQ